MSNIPYYNRAGPFWDFVASFDNRGQGQHPFANVGTYGEQQGHGGWDPRSPFSTNEQEQPPNYMDTEVDNEATPETMDHEDDTQGPSGQKSAETDKEKQGEHSHPSHPRAGHPHGHDYHQHQHQRQGCHGRGRSGWFGRSRGGPWQGPAGCGGRTRGGYGGAWGNLRSGGGRMRPGFGDLANEFASKMFGPGGPWSGHGPSDYADNNSNEDFSPPADVFDTDAAFFVHVSLAGAKKEDVAVNWDAENSVIIITGVVHRPGDEEFLKTLAMAERAVGAFERRVRLGSPANPARVEVDGITAKLEDGVLTIEIPKEDRDFVEVKKVDVE